MTNNLKIAAVGALAALGMTSAAVAQQSIEQKPNMSPEQHQQMMSGDKQHGHMMGMMGDPKMGQQMMQMMNDCNQMMQQMGTTPRAGTAPRNSR